LRLDLAAQKLMPPAADLDGDSDLDFAAPGKGGLFLFLNRSR
jgi:hypothetical protein